MATVSPDDRAGPEILGRLGPNWFASVMGTGIVATAAATLPVHVPGLRVFAEVVWVFAAVLIAVLVVAVGGHWLRHPTVARSHARNPQMAHFYGAAPMALLTVGVGSLLVGRDLVGERIAVDLDWVLWTGGHRRRALYGRQHPVPDVHAAQCRTRRHIRRMVDAGRVADGVGGHRCAADRARAVGRRPTDHALRVLRDVRVVACGISDHHHDDLDSTHLLRHLGEREGADIV